MLHRARDRNTWEVAGGQPGPRRERGAETSGPGSGLAARLRRGDVAAAADVLEDAAPRAYRVAMGLTRNAGQAEAIVREVFAALADDLEDAAGSAGLHRWVYRTTIRIALARRTLGRTGRVRPGLDRPGFTADGSHPGATTGLRPDRADAPGVLGARATLRRALGRLPLGERLAVLLCDVEGLTTAETAEILDEPVDATRRRLHRGRMTLREALTRALEAPPPGRRRV